MVDRIQLANPLQSFLQGQEAREFADAAPDRAKQRQLTLGRQQTAFDEGELNLATRRGQLLLNALNSVERSSADPQQRFQTAQRLVPELQSLGVEIDASQLSPEQFTNEGIAGLKAELTGFLGNPREGMTAFETRRRTLMEALQPGLDETGRLRPVNQLTAAQQSAAVELGLIPRAATSAQERIATDPALAGRVATTQADIAGQKAAATQEAKLNVERDIKPQIESAITQARADAKAAGENLTDLRRLRAALPGLQQVVSQLRELTPVASATVSERAFDQVARQLGFGATEGATARAKYIAIIDNELLPLLRQTFGAAFTEKEGERLKITLGDPNATAAEKNAQLDAFIEAKVREIETKEREAGQRPTEADFGSAEGVPEGRIARNPQTGQTLVVRNGRWVAQ